MRLEKLILYDLSLRKLTCEGTRYEQWRSQSLKHTRAHVLLIIIYPYTLQSFYCHIRQNKKYTTYTVCRKLSLVLVQQFNELQTAKQPAPHLQSPMISRSYAVIRLSKITARNEKGLTGQWYCVEIFILAQANFTRARPLLARLWLRHWVPGTRLHVSIYL